MALDRLKQMKLMPESVDRKILPFAPIFVYIAVFLVIPVLFLIYASVHTFDPFDLLGEWGTLEQYQNILFEPFYLDIIIYTAELALVTTIGCFAFGYLLGYYIARTTPRMRAFLLFLIFLPIMVGSMIRVYGWMTILGRQGIINDIIYFFTGSRIGIIGTTWAVYVGMISVLLPFVVLPVYSAVEKIPSSLELAARNLGANRFQAFYKVVFPLSLPGAITGSIFVFAITMSAVVVPMLLGGRGDITLGSIMYDITINDFNLPQASAIALILSTLTLAIIFTYLKLVKDKLEVDQGDAYK